MHHAEALPLSGRARDLARRMLAPAPPPVRAALLLAALALRPTTALVRRAGRPPPRPNSSRPSGPGWSRSPRTAPSPSPPGCCRRPSSTTPAGPSGARRTPRSPASSTTPSRPCGTGRSPPTSPTSASPPRWRPPRRPHAAAATTRSPPNSPCSPPSRPPSTSDAAASPGSPTPPGRPPAPPAPTSPCAPPPTSSPATPAPRTGYGPDSPSSTPPGQGLTDLDELYVHAMEDSEGSPALRAAVQLRLAVKHVLADGDLVRSRAAAVESAALAASVGDRHTAAQALTQQARVDRALGSPDAEGTLAEARALERTDRPLGVRNAAQILTIRHALFDDRLTEARDAINALLPPVERRGSVEDAIELLHTLAAVESRLGQGAAALQHAHRSLTLTLEAGLSPGPAWYTLALAESAGGSFARAMSYARRSAQASEEEGDHVFLSRALYVLGRVQLITGDVAAALDTLRRVQEGERALRIVDPSVLRWHEELAEVLLAHDAREEAESLLAEVSPVAERLGRTTVLLGCDRARAQCLAAAGRPEEAAGLLAVTAERFAEHGLVLEQGRCLIALARVERRRRRRSAAQQALNAAVAVFERAGAVPWLELVAEGPSRADAAPSGADALSRLTEAEVRLARMVGQGASNQEAAARLYLSVKTVEARLTRIYQKLDVRSRAQLATVINAGPAGLSGAGDGAAAPAERTAPSAGRPRWPDARCAGTAPPRGGAPRGGSPCA
ncbi:LuxR C-terminal-related transcriptional regulator [Streptomyces somaliensis]|nr:LuxR C-terminal-related transcriptional regulator [Streptomyces somaliensis]